jgi:hypothetical protein
MRNLNPYGAETSGRDLPAMDSIMARVLAPPAFGLLKASPEGEGFHPPRVGQ